MVSKSLKLTFNLLNNSLLESPSLRLVDVIFGIKGAFFSKTTRQICAKFFFQDLENTALKNVPGL